MAVRIYLFKKGNNRKYKNSGEISMHYCLACSPGGHFQQMQLLKKLFLTAEDTYFYITNYTPMYEGVAQKNFFLRNPKRNPLLHILNFFKTVNIILKEKPDVILSNGAGVALPAVLIGWLLRKKIIIIESLSRFSQKSLFAKITYPFATEFYVLWEHMLTKYGSKARYLNILSKNLSVDLNAFQKSKTIFVTVGSSDYNFDRLLRFTDYLAQIYPHKEFFFQVGNSKYIPKNGKSVGFLANLEFEKKFNKSDFIISHAGAGNLVLALLNNKKIFLIPRLSKYNEAINDHQLDLYTYFKNFVDPKLLKLFKENDKWGLLG